MTTLLDSYSENNYDDEIIMPIEHPSATLYDSVIGQTFTPDETGLLTSCKFYLRKKGAPSPEATFEARLYAMTGTFGTNGLPTGSILATSDSKTMEDDLFTSFQLIEFTFDGTYEIVTGSYYCICVVTTEERVLGLTNCMEIGVDTSSFDHAGNSFSYYSSAWRPYFASRCDICFYVYGDVTLPPSQRALKFMPIYGWESTGEEYLKVEISSAGALSSS